MSYDKDKVTDLVLELNSLLIGNPSRFNFQYLPQIVDKLYKEVHAVISEDNESNVEEIFAILDRLKERDEIRIKEMNNSAYASGEGQITIYYNFNPVSHGEHLKSIDDE